MLLLVLVSGTVVDVVVLVVLVVDVVVAGGTHGWVVAVVDVEDVDV